MTRIGTIRTWVTVMLVAAFLAGGSTFLFLGRMFGQVPEPHSPDLPKFREQWIKTYALSSDQIAQLDRVLERYEKSFDRLTGEMYQKYRPLIGNLQDSTEKELEEILTPAQRELQREEIERRRVGTGKSRREGR
jgi:hypothetical protein